MSVSVDLIRLLELQMSKVIHVFSVSFGQKVDSVGTEIRSCEERVEVCIMMCSG